MTMFLALTIGFISGFLLLSVTSRLLKSFALDSGFTPKTMFHIPKFPKSDNTRTVGRFKKLWLQFLMRSLTYGIVFAFIFAILFALLPPLSGGLVAIMLLTVALAGLIDLRVWLLPDFLTIPLLISGFAVSYFLSPIVAIDDSIIGALYAYILPLFATLFMQKYRSNPLGGGDVKMMAAMGAWLGFELFNIMLVISFVVFLGVAWHRGSKVAPYGPALALAVIITVIGNVLLPPLG